MNVTLEQHIQNGSIRPYQPCSKLILMRQNNYTIKTFDQIDGLFSECFTTLLNNQFNQPIMEWVYDNNMDFQGHVVYDPQFFAGWRDRLIWESRDDLNLALLCWGHGLELRDNE